MPLVLILVIETDAHVELDVSRVLLAALAIFVVFLLRTADVRLFTAIPTLPCKTSWGSLRDDDWHRRSTDSSRSERARRVFINDSMALSPTRGFSRRCPTSHVLMVSLEVFCSWAVHWAERLQEICRRPRRILLGVTEGLYLYLPSSVDYLVLTPLRPAGIASVRTSAKSIQPRYAIILLGGISSYQRS